MIDWNDIDSRILEYRVRVALAETEARRYPPPGDNPPRRSLARALAPLAARLARLARPQQAPPELAARATRRLNSALTRGGWGNE